VGSIFSIAPFLRTGVVFKLERNDILTLTNVNTGNYVQIKSIGSRIDFRIGNEDEDKKYHPLVVSPMPWVENIQENTLIKGLTFHLGRPPGDTHHSSRS
jgi:hypothetical protein